MERKRRNRENEEKRGGQDDEQQGDGVEGEDNKKLCSKTRHLNLVISKQDELGGKGEEARTSQEGGNSEGGRRGASSPAPSNYQICSRLLSLFSINLRPNSLFHHQNDAGYYLFITRNIMMDVFQSTPALIPSAWTLAQSVSTPLIITHDCCGLVSTPRTAGAAFKDHQLQRDEM